MNAISRIIISVLLIIASACGPGDVDVKKVTAGEGHLLLMKDGQEVRVPVKEMEIWLVDPDYDDQYPEKFEISGPGLRLVGTFPMDVHVSYREHFDRMLNRTIEIESSGNPSAHEEVDSYISITEQEDIYVNGGTLEVTKVIDRNILQGSISVELEGGGKTLSGTFVFTATTWG